mgnify:CR=1 FL=1
MIDNRIILIFLILLLICLMLYDCNKKEYFQDCIIYKHQQINNEKYYEYGELQLLYKYFNEELFENKELIKETYNDKLNNNSLIKTNKIDLDKLNRTQHLDKKLILNELDESNTDWSYCYFNDNDIRVFDKNIQPDRSTVNKNKVLFNRMENKTTEICDKINKIKTSSNDVDENIILLKIECNSDDINIEQMEKPSIVNINNIRIVKYNKKTKKIEPYEDDNHFIKYFFTLDINTLKFSPITRKVNFYIFKNHFCDGKYEIKNNNLKCFNINQLGFESIDFTNNNTIISEFDENRDIKATNCIEDEIISFDMVKSELKNKLLDNAKEDYNQCKNQIISDYRDDDYLYRHKNDNCVKKKVYSTKHCSYIGCNYHKKSCKYERDKKKINKYLDVLDVDSYNDLNQNKMFYIKDVSLGKDEKNPYNICKKYIDYNTDFYKQIENLDSGNTMLDSALSNFDTEDLYTDFNILQDVSQDNCIYIFIKNI